MYKVIDDNKNDFFLTPIPRWITLYGFIGIIFVSIILFCFACFFKIPKEIKLKTIIQEQNSYVETDFQTVEQISFDQKLEIKLPLSTTKVYGILQPQNIWFENDKVYIPVEFGRKIFKKRVIFYGINRTEGRSILITMFSR